MGKKKKSKKKHKGIFDSIRKPLAPRTKKFRTRKDELARKAKHKRKETNGITD